MISNMVSDGKKNLNLFGKKIQQCPYTTKFCKYWVDKCLLFTVDHITTSDHVFDCDAEVRKLKRKRKRMKKNEQSLTFWDFQYCQDNNIKLEFKLYDYRRCSKIYLKRAGMKGWKLFHKINDNKYVICKAKESKDEMA